MECAWRNSCGDTTAFAPLGPLFETALTRNSERSTIEQFLWMQTQHIRPEGLDRPVIPVESIRARFPALERLHGGKPVAYFDGPGGTQVPREVVNAMCEYLFSHNANTHWQYPTSKETDRAIARAREAFADFLNCSPEEVVFGNNMTTLTFHVSRALGRNWGLEDEIVVTELDHQANVAPWQALERERGVKLRSVPFDKESGELIWEELERLINRKTRLVALGAASNALGTVSPIREAARLAHAHGALCFVDAVHFAAHLPIDVVTMECDFLVCSPYKFYGPHVGVLFGRAEILADIEVPKLIPAPNEVPERVETGTQNHEGIAGSGAAVDFLASLGEGANRREQLGCALWGLHKRSHGLFSCLWEGLKDVDGITCYGPPPERLRTPTLSMTVAGIPSDEVARMLATEGLFVSHGNFYATKVVEGLGVVARNGLVRVGCSCYTTENEIHRLIDALRRIDSKFA